MQKYIKTYLDFFGYSEGDFVPCEVCGAESKDIHHIIPRSQIFGEKRDEIENLIGLCRQCHSQAHFQQQPFLKKEELRKIHHRNIR